MQDKKDKKFYDCKVLAVKEEMFKVHFKGWKARYDEWLTYDSQRLVKLASVVSGCQQGNDEQLCMSTRLNTLQQRSDSDRRNPHSTPLQSNLLGSTMNQMPGEVEGSRGAAVSKLVAGADSEALRDSGVKVHCALCELVIVGDAIVCAGCGGKFHSDVICVGVDDEVISCLLRVRNGALQYFCCKCRGGANGLNRCPC